jgi:hypothetical protein
MIAGFYLCQCDWNTGLARWLSRQRIGSQTLHVVIFDATRSRTRIFQVVNLEYSGLVSSTTQIKILCMVRLDVQFRVVVRH